MNILHQNISENDHYLTLGEYKIDLDQKKKRERKERKRKDFLGIFGEI